jgi:hypothetical protein
VEGLEPPTLGLEIPVRPQILRQIKNLIRQNANKSGKIRNPGATRILLNPAKAVNCEARSWATGFTDEVASPLLKYPPYPARTMLIAFSLPVLKNPAKNMCLWNVSGCRLSPKVFSIAL